ncbi:MAG: hypothetical protein KatS3mg112_0018 [Thermogutta sp.]|nr:MAG: hypothetical protein KatS3mg112_0018 [Thermogutta sp.]
MRKCACWLVCGVLVMGLAASAVAEDGWITIPIKPGLPGWKLKGSPEQSKWQVGTAAVDPNDPRALICKPGGEELVNVGSHGVDIYTEQTFGDAIIEIEVMVPKGSNSGIYVMGEYEIQVLDSYGKEKLGMGDMGALYSIAVPKVNASKKPGEWQKYVIEYRAPRFDATGKKIANGRLVKVVLNGQVIHENLELPSQTPGGVTGKEAPRGPIMLQGNHGPVAYRNIRVKPLD